jgi:hypothetical protein
MHRTMPARAVAGLAAAPGRSGRAFPRTPHLRRWTRTHTRHGGTSTRPRRMSRSAPPIAADPHCQSEAHSRQGGAQHTPATAWWKLTQPSCRLHSLTPGRSHRLAARHAGPVSPGTGRSNAYHPGFRGFTARRRGRRATAPDRQAGPPWGPEMCGCETRAVPGGPQGPKEPTCSVPGRSVRPGARQSRPGRRSDDGQMILPRRRATWNALLTRCCLACQESSRQPSPVLCEPSPSPGDTTRTQRTTCHARHLIRRDPAGSI